MRTIVLAALCLLPANLYAQVSNFQPEDVGKLIVIAASWQQIEGFDWTPEQYDALARKTVDYRQLTGPASLVARRERPSEEERRQLLDAIYDVANEKQIQRLHQVFFQRLMNYGQLEIPLQAFVPGAIQDRDEKLKQLDTEIAEKLKQVTNDLPQVNPHSSLGRGSNFEAAQHKLAAFLDWRWKKQVGWLRAELGEDKTNELIGAPILLGYSFLIEGDPDTPGGSDLFGGPPWGGSLYGAHTSGMTTSGSNGARHVTLGVGNFDPRIGKIREPKSDRRNRYGQVQGPKPPVRVPDGMTLEKAKAQLNKLQEDIFTMTEETGALLNAMRQDMRQALKGPNGGEAFRMSREQQRLIEADLAHDIAKIRVDITRWSRIIEELGGDPHEQQTKIREARLLFFHHHLYRCNDNTFLSNIGATAEQCDALDKIAEDIGTTGPQNNAAFNAYIARVKEVLDERQQALVDQQVFRSHWFSNQAARAFAGTKIQLTNEHLAMIDDVTTRFAAAKEAEQDRLRLTSRLHGGIPTRRPETYYVDFAQEFQETLDEIVGEEAAKQLLGSPFKYNEDWKRPVKIPAGLTREQAAEEYKKLKAEKDEIDSEVRAQMGYGGFFGGAPQSSRAEMKAKEKAYKTLDHRLQKAKRILEELKSRDGN